MSVSLPLVEYEKCFFSLPRSSFKMVVSLLWSSMKNGCFSPMVEYGKWLFPSQGVVVDCRIFLLFPVCGGGGEGGGGI